MQHDAFTESGKNFVTAFSWPRMTIEPELITIIKWVSSPLLLSVNIIWDHRLVEQILYVYKIIATVLQ